MRNVVASALLLSVAAGAQSQAPPSGILLTVDTQDPLVRSATPIEVTFADGHRTEGSGFFYQTLAPLDPKNGGWQGITGQYVVTAKHLLEDWHLDDIRTFTFMLRAKSDKGVVWRRVDIEIDDLKKILHFAPNKEVDVAVIDIARKLSEVIKPGLELLAWETVSKEDSPQNSPIKVSAADDVIVVGFPESFYDTYNKLPVLKLGLLNTPIDFHYQGKDAFLVDFKAFRGSSGSAVFSKPTNIATGDNGLLYSKTKKAVLLGVYTGEERVRRGESIQVDLGLCWAYYTIEDAIKNPPISK